MSAIGGGFNRLSKQPLGVRSLTFCRRAENNTSIPVTRSNAS